MTVVTLRPEGNVAVAIKRRITSEAWNYLPICIRIALRNFGENDVQIHRFSSCAD